MHARSEQFPLYSGHPSRQQDLSNEGTAATEQAARSCGDTDTLPTATSRLASTELDRRVQNIVNLRRRRESLFGVGLFGEPAWDMLLVLYAADISNRSELVIGLCRASGVPTATAHRWIKLLESHGWICRRRDSIDARRCFVSLTDKSRGALDQFFAQPELNSLL